MSCQYADNINGDCCEGSWPGGNCKEEKTPNWNAGCGAVPCCPSGGCPTPSGGGGGGGGDSGTIPKGCEKACSSFTSSAAYESTSTSTSIPPIKSISISDNQLVINYGGDTPVLAINPWPATYKSKVMWLYTCPIGQGLACLPTAYSKADGMDIFVEKIKDSSVNFISLICNNSFQKASDLGIRVPKSSASFTSYDSYPPDFVNNKLAKAAPSGSHQTAISFSKEQLIKLHEAGITIVMSVGSWMSDFPRDSNGSANWTKGDYVEYVDRFECMRCALGNSLDGLDFDIEGTCATTCLFENCTCGWDSGCTGNGGGPTNAGTKQCYILPDKGTVKVMNGIAKEMKHRGYVVTTVPPTNVMFSSDKGASQKYNGQNQFIEYGLDFENIDGVMLQFYTGFDAGMCGPNYEFCKANNITDLHQLQHNIHYLEGKGIKADNSTSNPLPNYPNYPNRSPVHCPRYLDCPDWQYEGEKAFQRQSEYFNDLTKIPNLPASKIALGLEFFFNTSQWGPFPSPTLFYGLNDTLKNSHMGEDLGGIGGWTIAGTFGEYNPGKDAPSAGGGICDCERTNYETPEGGVNGNMWCVGPYWQHFENNITQCWGSWGRNKGELKHKTIQCYDYGTNKYCKQKDNKYYVECTPIPAEKGTCTPPPVTPWPPIRTMQ
jgi:hypothetical protein